MKHICIFVAFTLVFIVLPFRSMAGEEPPIPAGLEDMENTQTAREPALPSGLDMDSAADSGPALPQGLGPMDSGNEPVLPPGISGPGADEETLTNNEQDSFPVDLTGFFEIRTGVRLHEDEYQKDGTLQEARFQLEAESILDETMLKFTGDVYYDRIDPHHSIKLEQGKGFFDLREAWILLRPASFMDLKAGRQVLTWGLGDLVFINDLFPKDWNSFFAGRDDEYLKAPSDAIKGSFFFPVCSIDIVYSPRFDPNRYIDGTRFSYYGPGGITGADIVVEERDRWFSNGELALRIKKNISATEVSFYGYRGYFKDPVGMDPYSGKAVFPRLDAAGASLRTQVFSGILKLETGIYHSVDDSSGEDIFIPNSEVRFLAGYEHELGKDFTGGVQYYIEHMLDYGNYKKSMLSLFPMRDMVRHLITIRLTKLLFHQNLTLSFFGYFSPSDQDFYLRPKVSYKATDHLLLESGINWFAGSHDYTFFGQFEKGTNIYCAVRYSY